MSPSVRVAAVIPVHNRKELTLQCLKSMGRLVLEGIELRICVVDDGSEDGTAEALRSEYPEVEIVQGDGNLWYTGAINAGIEKAFDWNPNYFLLMNDDQVFDADALRHLVGTAEAIGNCAVGGLLLLWDTPHRIFQVSPMWRMRWGGWRHWQNQTVWSIPDMPWEVDLIVGNCLLVPAEAIKAHGPMDAVRFPNYGDAELTPRLKRKGLRLVLEPRARVFCQPNNLPPSVERMTWSERYRHLWSDLRMTQNIRRRWRAWIAGAPDPLNGALAFLVFFMRYLLRRNLEGGYGHNCKEPELRTLIPSRKILKVESRVS
jgi:GT2 family glycosyltransferase